MEVTCLFLLCKAGDCVEQISASSSERTALCCKWFLLAG